MHPISTIKYIAQSAYAFWNPEYCKDDEFGRCSICGNYGRFKHGLVVRPESEIAVSCGWDKQFTEEINITNTLKCRYCASKFRVRCAAESMLKYFWKGKIISVAELLNGISEGRIDANWHALETTANDGIFTGLRSVNNVVRSEYFDNIERGRCKDGVRSEDLQDLTFSDNAFDVVIALDVFEHISDPLKAFAEVRRALKPSGVGIITVPLDRRIIKTKTIAKMDSGKIVYLDKQAYHSDPLRKEGAPVFTEFGMDMVDNLSSLGYNASWDIYKTRRTGVEQRVILLKKVTV